MARIFGIGFIACLISASCSSAPSYGLMDSDVVCGSCSPEYLQAKTAGVKNALRVMIAQIGDMHPRRGRITFHLDMDQTCTDIVTEAAKEGKTVHPGGFARCGDDLGACDICFRDETKQNLEYAKSLAGQVLPLHEAGHVWWKGRENQYNAEEPMVQMMSFGLSGADWCSLIWGGVPLSLVGDLCRAGITNAQVIRIYTSAAARSVEVGRELTGEELAQIVSAVMGKDMRASFVAAGIIAG